MARSTALVAAENPLVAFTAPLVRYVEEWAGGPAALVAIGTALILITLWAESPRSTLILLSAYTAGHLLFTHDFVTAAGWVLLVGYLWQRELATTAAPAARPAPARPPPAASPVAAASGTPASARRASASPARASYSLCPLAGGCTRRPSTSRPSSIWVCPNCHIMKKMNWNKKL